LLNVNVLSDTVTAGGTKQKHNFSPSRW
jgi:hypothetical protein